ncbi:alpha/beta fold hydrolase [Francisella marina]|uniref:Alpha/beta hydrolase n=1 Tax=Francisella marina TaxID=2249302 RepID=A0ABX5ZHR5_9GAMM|nr:alpha/beta fold hydrolase [Francisella marina]QEO57539.1 alpha/beta hydrolase [Francisella marina]QEO58342.1 alpha/beta hydrolase [Francisella marina]
MKKIVLTIFLITITTSIFALDIQSKEIMINKNKVHYYQVNNSKSDLNLIMLTGIGTTANFWPKDFIDILSQKYNLYILDYRGINTSQDNSNVNYSIYDLGNDTNSFIKKLNLKNTYLLGWSMGTTIALQTAFDKSKSFKKIFLISPPLPTSANDNSTKFKKTPKFNSNDDIYNYVFNNNLYKYSPKDLTTEKSRFINSDISTLFPTPEVYAKQKIARNEWISNKDAINNFVNIDIPTVIFLSKNDQIEHIDSIQKTISLVKNKSIVSTIYLNKSGHAIDWDQSLKLANIINNLA